MGLSIFSKLVVYITYNMGKRDLPDIYALARGPQAQGLGHIYQANPSCPCYNYYIYAKQKHPCQMQKREAKSEAPVSFYSYMQLKSVISGGGQGPSCLLVTMYGQLHIN